MVLFFLSYIFLNPFTNSDVIAEVDTCHKQARAILFQHPDSALAIAEKALNMSESADYTWGIANSYYFKGYILEEVQNKSVAGLLMYLKAGHILENQLDERSVGAYTGLMLNAGSVLHKHGKNDEAIDLYEKALKKAKLFNLKIIENKLLFNIAFASRDKGDLPKAIETIKAAIELSERLEDRKLLNDSWNLLGMILKDDLRNNEAEKCFLTIVNNPDSRPIIKANAYNNLGDLYISEEKFEQAVSAYLKAGQLHTIPVIKFDSYLGLTNVFQQTGDLSNALKYASEAVHVYDSVVPEDRYLQVFNIISQLHQQKGDQQLANHYSNRYFEETQKFFQAQKELIKIKNEFQVDLLLAGFYTEMEIEATEEKYSNVLVFGTTIFFAAILLVHLAYRRRISSSREKIRRILNDYR
ncbi:MAG: hypothetical protein RIA62_03395 [Cyclobacteriaceae bacterium]